MANTPTTTFRLDPNQAAILDEIAEHNFTTRSKLVVRAVAELISYAQENGGNLPPRRGKVWAPDTDADDDAQPELAQ